LACFVLTDSHPTQVPLPANWGPRGPLVGVFPLDLYASAPLGRMDECPQAGDGCQ
jgi:hypothetical protein